MKQLYERIDMLSEEPTKYSAPNEVIDLPFPSVNEIPPRFSLLDDRKISYMSVSARSGRRFGSSRTTRINVRRSIYSGAKVLASLISWPL